MPKITKPEPVSIERKSLTDFDIREFGKFMDGFWKEKESPRFGKLRFYDVPKAMLAYGAMTDSGAVISKYDEFMEKLDRLSSLGARREKAKTKQVIDQARHSMLGRVVHSETEYPNE